MLEGSRALLNRCRPALLIELHGTNGCNSMIRDVQLENWTVPVPNIVTNLHKRDNKEYNPRPQGCENPGAEEIQNDVFDVEV